MSFVFWLVPIVIGCSAIWVFLKWFDRKNPVKMVGRGDGDREAAKLEPYFRREVVERKVKSLFPNHEPAEILQLLDDDIPSFWGLERMQLNILKASNGDLDQLIYHIATAKSEREFMNVIKVAEYPEGSLIGLENVDKLPYEEYRRIRERDLRQYLDWLKKK